MAPALNIGLQHSQLSKSFPRAVLHGPKEEGGRGVINLYTTQGLSHVAIIHEHLEADTITGHLLRTSLEQHTVELEVQHKMFELDYDHFSDHVTDTWLKHTWKFCDENNIKLIERHTPDLKVRRLRDSFLMQDFIKEGYTGENY